MSFRNSAMMNKRKGGNSSTHQVRFENKAEFPDLCTFKNAVPQSCGKGLVYKAEEGDDRPDKIRFEIAKTLVSQKSVEQLNWEQRNAMMQKLLNCRFYGITKSTSPNWDYDGDYYSQEDEDEDEDEEWYRCNDEAAEEEKD